jgi:hypothetical protein
VCMRSIIDYTKITQYSLCFVDRRIRRSGWSSGNAVDLYSRGTRFEFRLEYCLVFSALPRIFGGSTSVKPRLLLSKIILQSSVVTQLVVYSVC